MNGNTLKISRNPSGQEEGDLYEKIKTRPGTTEKQKETGRNAYTELLEAHARWVGGSLLGAAFSKDFKQKGGSRLLGRNVKSASDLAVLAQILRDPRFETFRVFFVKDDKIIHHTAVCSRLPGVVHLDKDVLEHFKRIHGQVKADGYWLLHNHPTGHSEPSSADINMTIKLADNVPGFKGHVVINTNEYSIIDKAGNVNLVKDMSGLAGGYANSPYKDHDTLQMRVTSPAELAQVGQLLKQQDQFFTLIGLNTKGFVQAVCEIPLSILQQKDHILHARLQSFARNAGINSVFAITDSNNLNHPKFIKAVESGILADVMANPGHEDNQSLREMGFVPIVTNGTRAELHGKGKTIITDNVLQVKRSGGRSR